MLPVLRRCLLPKSLKTTLSKKAIVYYNFIKHDQPLREKMKSAFNIPSRLNTLSTLQFAMMSPDMFWTEMKQNSVLKQFEFDWFQLYNTDSDKLQTVADSCLTTHINELANKNKNLQHNFIENLQKFNNFQELSALLSAARYDVFLQCLKKDKSLCPPLDVDIIWHSHILSLYDYRLFCYNEFGHLINHILHFDEKNEENDQQRKDTIELWNEYVYNELNQDDFVELLGIDTTNKKLTDQIDQVDFKQLFQYSYNPFIVSTTTTTTTNGKLHPEQNNLILDSNKFISKKKDEDWDFLFLTQLILMNQLLISNNHLNHHPNNQNNQDNKDNQDSQQSGEPTYTPYHQDDLDFNNSECGSDPTFVPDLEPDHIGSCGSCGSECSSCGSD